MIYFLEKEVFKKNIQDGAPYQYYCKKKGQEWNKYFIHLYDKSSNHLYQPYSWKLKLGHASVTKKCYEKKSAANIKKIQNK